MANTNDARMAVQKALNSLTSGANDTTPPQLLSDTRKNVNKDPTSTQLTPGNTFGIEIINDRLRALQLHPSKKQNVPYALESYLNEAPKDGGSTYGLVHGARVVIPIFTTS